MTPTQELKLLRRRRPENEPKMTDAELDQAFDQLLGTVGLNAVMRVTEQRVAELITDALNAPRGSAEREAALDGAKALNTLQLEFIELEHRAKVRANAFSNR